MAMTTCPQCGKEVSDKALKCVQCGYEFEKIIQKKTCSECGAELDDEATVCSNCGAPVEEPVPLQQPLRQAEADDGKHRKFSPRFIIVGAIVIVVIIAAAFMSRYIKESIAKEDYASNIQLVTYTMLSGAGDAENCGILIYSVWHNSIFEESDEATDEYTRPNGYFVDDFNTALENLFSDSDFNADISSIRENQDSVQQLMKELKNPTDEYADAYAAVLELYSAYTELMICVTNPSGSLKTFSQNFNDARSNVLNCYNAVALYIDN